MQTRVGWISVALVTSVGHLVFATEAITRFRSVEYFVPSFANKNASPVEGTLACDAETKLLTFAAGNATYIRIPYGDITSVTYEKTARPRYATMAYIPLLVFTKEKKHFLTIQYKQESNRKFAIFRLHKATYQTVLATIEAATGMPAYRSVE
jgi:hypothetical protein